MNKFIEPSVKLMDKLKYPQKFLVISFVFLLLIFILMYLIIFNIDNQIKISKSELPGITFIKASMILVEDIQTHRTLTNSYFYGKKSFELKIKDMKIKIDDDFKKLEELSQKHKFEDNIQKERKDIFEQWQKIKKADLNINPNENFKNHNELINSNFTLIRMVGVNSNVILDPDIGTTIIYRRIPLLLETLAQTRDISLQLIQKASFSNEEKTTLKNLIREFNYEFRFVPSVILNNFKKYPEVVEEVKPILLMAKDKGRLYEIDIEKLFDEKYIDENFYDYYQKGNELFILIKNLFDFNIDSLGQIVKKRIKRLENYKYLLLGVFFLVLFFVSYLFVGFYYSTIKTIQKLKKVSEDVSHGNLEAKVKVTTKDELAGVADAINIMIKNLYEAQDYKNMLMASLAHDIKSPIISEQKALEAICDERFGTSLEDFKEYLFEMIKTNNELINLMNNILTIYHYESGAYTLNKKPNNIGNMIESAINSIRQVIDENESKLIQDIEENIPEVSFDESEIKRVIMNLILNSVKHNPRGTQVNIAVKKAENKLLVSVSDNGVGIPKEETQNIFQKYPFKKSKIGTGLGLYLSKQIIDAHNGSIWFDTQEGKGTTFYFHLPYE